MTDAEWDQIFDVHVKGAYTCTKAAWPLMRKQKFGRIINVSGPLSRDQGGISRPDPAAALDLLCCRNLRFVFFLELQSTSVAH